LTFFFKFFLNRILLPERNICAKDLGPSTLVNEAPSQALFWRLLCAVPGLGPPQSAGSRWFGSLNHYPLYLRGRFIPTPNLFSTCMLFPCLLFPDLNKPEEALAHGPLTQC
jgi:hypothetical protein